MIEGLVRASDAGLGDTGLRAAYTQMQARVGAGLAGEGLVWVDRLDRPTVGVLIFGMVFPLGDAGHAFAARIVRNLPPMLSVVPPNNAWLTVIKSEWGPLFAAKPFWHFEPAEALDSRLSVPPLPRNCRMEQIDQGLFEPVQQLDADLFSGHPDFEAFAAHSKGYCAVTGDRVVCAATIVASHGGLAEIAVYCAPDFRRRGLAQNVSAALLHACHARALKVYWEAENPESCKLALKMGFSSAQAYSVCRRKSH